jgi:hypothetical protein
MARVRVGHGMAGQNYCVLGGCLLFLSFPIGLNHFQAKLSPVWITQHFSNLVIIYLLAYEDGTDSVPKRRHIKFRHQRIAQKKAYDIQNAAKV